MRPEDYDVIAVGTPTWWYTMAPAVLTFLTAHNWKGKTVIPFQTHGGWSEHTIKDIRSACKGAKIIQPMKIRFDSTGGDEMVTTAEEVAEWAERVKRYMKEAL